jgi:hypothetical protein
VVVRILRGVGYADYLSEQFVLHFGDNAFTFNPIVMELLARILVGAWAILPTLFMIYFYTDAVKWRAEAKRRKDALGVMFDFANFMSLDEDEAEYYPNADGICQQAHMVMEEYS